MARRNSLIREAPEPLAYAQCRSLGHEWRHKGRVSDDDPERPFEARAGMIGLRSQCSECKTIRTKWVTRSGEVMAPRYEYPEGYSQHGEERMRPQQWRSAFVAKLFDDPALGLPALKSVR